MKPVQPFTAQPVKHSKAPPLLLTSLTFNKVTKDAVASSNKMLKEKEVKKERKDNLPFIDRSTIELKSDSSTCKYSCTCKHLYVCLLKCCNYFWAQNLFHFEQGNLFLCLCLSLFIIHNNNYYNWGKSERAPLKRYCIKNACLFVCPGGHP